MHTESLAARTHALSRPGTRQTVLTTASQPPRPHTTPATRACVRKYAVSHHFFFTNGLIVLFSSGSDRFSRFQCSRTANLNGSALLCRACSESPTQPLYFSETNTNFASMYLICSSNESPSPSRPIALPTSRVQ